MFVFVDLFDTAGTLIGVGQQGGFVKYGKLPRVNRALMPDAVATTAGAAFGTSTVTCYIESSTGIAEGGRTGLTSVVTACLFLSALFFAPLVRMRRRLCCERNDILPHYRSCSYYSWLSHG